MAVLVDASSPVRFSFKGISGTNLDSANFTAPANALLVLCLAFDGSSTNGTQTNTISLTTGSALTWTLQVARLWAETTNGGSAYIYTAPAVTSEARVLRVNSTWTTGDLRRSGKIYCVTGVYFSGTPVDTVTASNEGGSTTNSINTTSITPGATGLLFASAADWAAGGGAAYAAPADGSTQDTAWYSGEISAVSGYKVATVSVALGMNLDAGGAAAAQHKWCQIVVREAPTGAAPTFTLPNDRAHRPAAFRPGLAR